MRVQQALQQVVDNGPWAALDSVQLEVRAWSCPALSESCLLEVEPLTQRLRGGNVFRVSFLEQGRLLRSLSLSATVRTWEQVPVAARDLPRGHILGPDDLAVWNGRETTQLSQVDLPAPTEALGLQLNRYIAQGRLVHHRMLHKLPDLERGQRITVTVSTEGVRVSAAGKLEQDACLGELAPVRLLESGRRLQARIISLDQALVEVTP